MANHWKLSRKRGRRRPAFVHLDQPRAHPTEVQPIEGASPTTMRLIAYGPDRVEEKPACGVDDIRLAREQFPVTWVDVAGLANVELIQQIGQCFSLHPLSIEDVIHTHQRAKVEDYGSYHFLVVRMAPCAGEELTDQLSMFLGDGFVITFQERPGDDLEGVRERLRSSKGRICHHGADYLAYALLDAAVDAYFPILEQSGELLEDMEDDVVMRPDPALLTRIYEIRRKLLMLRRALWPLREAVSALVRDDSSRFTHDTKAYLRDVYDHTIQIIDLMESYRELSSNLMDVYLSSTGNRLNEIMKVLTIISVVFIPLTFIAGVYGMNFDPASSPYNMPELKAHFGYPICIATMLIIGLLELIYFHRKGWIGKSYAKRAAATTARTAPDSRDGQA